MRVKWTSFPYRAEFADPALEFADRVAGGTPSQLCQAERHTLAQHPAAYLEVFYSSSGDIMTVHRAWFTCSGCHAKLGAEYDPDIG
jgi:hypothetical protein